MKIGILTQPLCNNYGGILQNYALQTYLKRLGHTPVTLDVPPPISDYSLVRLGMSCLKRLLLKSIGRKDVIFINPITQRKKEVSVYSIPQRRFIDRYIDRLIFHPPFSETMCKWLSLDAYIVGSDQVWRPRYTQYLTDYYLGFIGREKNIKRIAYAASFGVANWEADKITTDKIRQLIRKFDAISVREISGVFLCRDVLGVSASHVIDPTMLLSAEDYRALFETSASMQTEYIGVYVLDMSSDKQRIIEQISRKIQLPIKYIGCMTKDGFPAIEEWLSDISGARFVITDSFHGSVFAILFTKQFVTISNSARGVARFESLFEMFGLCDRLTNLHAFNFNLLDRVIDYDGIQTILANERQKAKEFLQRALE